MTSARSGKASPVAPRSGAQHQDAQQNGDPGYDLPTLVGRAGELEVDRACASRQLDSDHGIIGAADSSRLPISGSNPARIVILRNHQRSTGRSRLAQANPHASRLVML